VQHGDHGLRQFVEELTDLLVAVKCAIAIGCPRAVGHEDGSEPLKIIAAVATAGIAIL